MYEFGGSVDSVRHTAKHTYTHIFFLFFFFYSTCLLPTKSDHWGFGLIIPGVVSKSNSGVNSTRLPCMNLELRHWHLYWSIWFSALINWRLSTVIAKKPKGPCQHKMQFDYHHCSLDNNRHPSSLLSVYCIYRKTIFTQRTSE